MVVQRMMWIVGVDGRNKRQVDTYIDVELVFADAKVVATLSIDGPNR